MVVGCSVWPRRFRFIHVSPDGMGIGHWGSLFNERAQEGVNRKGGYKGQWGLTEGWWGG